MFWIQKQSSSAEALPVPVERFSARCKTTSIKWNGGPPAIECKSCRRSLANMPAHTERLTRRSRSVKMQTHSRACHVNSTSEKRELHPGAPLNSDVSQRDWRHQLLERLNRPRMHCMRGR